MRSRGGAVGSFASSPYAGGAQAAESGGLRIGSLGAAAVDLGTAKNPVHMMQVQRRTVNAAKSYVLAVDSAQLLVNIRRYSTHAGVLKPVRLLYDACFACSSTHVPDGFKRKNALSCTLDMTCGPGDGRRRSRACGASCGGRCARWASRSC